MQHVHANNIIFADCLTHWSAAGLVYHGALEAQSADEYTCEFCESRSVYLNQKYILIAFSNYNMAWKTFYKSKLPEVQINLHFR